MATYYVKKTGNDSTGDGSSGNPWLTIQHGHDQMADGDTLYVDPGSYNERLVTTKSNITISGTDEVTRPEIWYRNTANYQNVVSLTRGCTFENFEVHADDSLGDDGLHYQDRGIVVGGNSGAWNTGYVTVRNCVVHHTGAAGLMANYQDGCLFEDNTVYSTAGKNYQGRAWYVDENNNPGPDYLGYHPGGTSFSRGANYTIRNNTVYNVWGEGLAFDFNAQNIQCYGNTVGDSYGHKIYVGEVHDGYFYQNLVFSSLDSGYYIGGGLGMTDESYTANQIDIDNVHFYNNIVVNCSVGIWIDHGYAEHNTKNAFFYNNTIVVLSSGRTGITGFGTDYLNVTITNNIFYIASAASATGSVPANIGYGRNIWSKVPAAGAQGAYDLYNTDPVLVDPTNAIYNATQLANIDANDYKIQSSSPAINYGDTQITTDYFGSVRAGIVDVGAHEYDGTAAPPDVDTAEDWGAGEYDGLHYNTVIQNEADAGRYFNGTNAFVDLNPLAAVMDMDNGATFIKARLDASGYTDNGKHRIFEAYAWNNSTQKSSSFFINQSGFSKRLEFTWLVEDIAVQVLYVTANTSWQTLAVTWDTGEISAYADGSLIDTITHPDTWIASGFDFIRVGSGGNQSYTKGQIAHCVNVWGETPTAQQVADISAYIAADSLTAARLDARFTNWAWHNLRDAEGETVPEAFVCYFEADVTSGDIPLTTTWDFTASEIPSGEVIDYIEFSPAVSGGYAKFAESTIVIDGPDLPDAYEYIYTIAGTYTAHAKIVLESGEVAQFVRRNYVTADPTWDPSEFVADFEADETSGVVPHEVTFDLTGCLIPAGFTLDYGLFEPSVNLVAQDAITLNGPTLDSSVVYTYNKAGFHTVALTLHLVENSETAVLYQTEYIHAYIDAVPAPAETDEVLALIELLQMIDDNKTIIEGAV